MLSCPVIVAVATYFVLIAISITPDVLAHLPACLPTLEHKVRNLSHRSCCTFIIVVVQLSSLAIEQQQQQQQQLAS